MNTHDIDRLIDKIESSAAMDIAGRSKYIHDLRAAIEADRKRRGEPVLVGWTVSTTGGGILHASKYTECEAKRSGYSLPVYRLTSPQPAEPDLAKCAECGAEMIHVRPGKWQHPDCPQSPRAAEPVKSHLKVSYDDKGDCLYVVCDSNEPADAEEDDKGILYRRAISDGRLVGITIANFMGQSRYVKGTP